MASDGTHAGQMKALIKCMFKQRKGAGERRGDEFLGVLISTSGANMS